MYRGREVVVKYFILKRITRKLVQMFSEEATTLCELRHQNIVDFSGCVVNPPKMGIVMEYCSNGTLFDTLKNRTLNFQKTNPLRIAREIASGMAYLHSKRRVHGDLKSLNILLDDQWTAQVADFGDSFLLSDISGMSNREEKERGGVLRGTAAWKAPELLKGDHPTLKVDVYSYGIVLWELLVWKFPFVMVSEYEEKDPIGYHAKRREKHDAKQRMHVLSEDPPRTPTVCRDLEIEGMCLHYIAEKALRPPLPIGAPSGLINLLRQCLSQNPRNRTKL
eukprot:TRINITY_DN3713_c0_g1_i1.p1 TRINITY_DN3713_c0_g1~~TRINITY_DN3713_c0_g1_i1.p1  ORF type:complete len:278 (+),score=31.09 TRINITY_DN3713_c0_g1_i1:262-1095(+)